MKLVYSKLDGYAHQENPTGVRVVDVADNREVDAHDEMAEIGEMLSSAHHSQMFRISKEILLVQ